MAATVFPAPGAGSGSIQWNLYSNTTTASSSASTITLASGTTNLGWIGATPVVNSGTGQFANSTIITSVASTTTYSAAFSGSGQYLTVPSTGTNAAFTFAGNFTVEGWFYPTLITGSDHAIFCLGTETTNRYVWYISNGGGVTSNLYGSGSKTYAVSTPVNTWTHIAIVRSGSTVSVYVNGVVSSTTDTQAGTIGNGVLKIGSDSGGTAVFQGYISNFRVSSVAVYTSGTGGFTGRFNLPTTTLTATQLANVSGYPSATITGSQTSVLTCQSATIIDNGFANAGAGFTISNTGPVTVSSTIIPYLITPGNTFTVNTAPSVALSGANISILMGNTQVVTDNSRTVGKLRSAITVKTPTANTNYFNIPKLKSAITVKNPTPGDATIWDQANLQKQIEVFKNPTPRDDIVYDAFNINKWKMPPNGIQGFFPPSSSNLRKQLEVFKQPGSMYGNYTLSPFASSAWASKLNSNLTAVGQSSPKSTNYTTVSSITTSGSNTLLTVNNYYATFNGSTQYLSAAQTVGAITTGPFTIEAWVNPTTYAGNPFIIEDTYWNIGNNGGWYFQINSTGTLQLGYSTATFNSYGGISSTGTLSAGVWSHIAVVRDINNFVSLYINGQLANSPTVLAQSLNLNSGGTQTNWNTRIACHIADSGFSNGFQGSISNVRIVVGKAVYTGNFTPLGPLSRTQPARQNVAALGGTETSLLALQTATVTADSSVNNFTLTNNGSIGTPTQNTALGTVPAVNDYALVIDTVTNNQALAQITAVTSNANPSYTLTIPTSNLSNLNSSNTWAYQLWDPEVFQQSNVVTNTSPATARERLYYSTLAPGRYGNYIPYKTAPAATSTANYFNTGKLRSAIVIKNPSPRDDIYYDAFNLSKRIEVIKNPTPRDNIAYRSNNINRFKWVSLNPTPQDGFYYDPNNLQKRIEVTRSPTQVPSSYSLSIFAAPYTYFNNTNRVAVGTYNGKYPQQTFSVATQTTSGSNKVLVVNGTPAASLNIGDYVVVTDTISGNQVLTNITGSTGVIVNPVTVPVAQAAVFGNGTSTGIGITGGTLTAGSGGYYTFQWTCPANVYSVSVVAIGGGGSGGFFGGGGAGGLGWKNNISVTPGQSYTVQVGIGGAAVLSANITSANSPSGGDSWFLSPTTVKGSGGEGGHGLVQTKVISGGYIGDGGGSGGTPYGNLGNVPGGDGTYNGASGGGMGTGGYNGNGGGGSSYGGSSGSPPDTGSGGGASGDTSPGSGAGGGGGVGIFGIGADGTIVNFSGTGSSPAGGGGGSGGTTGGQTNSASYRTLASGGGGLYGGGGGGCDQEGPSSGAGGYGAVRIIWPATKIQDASPYRRFSATVPGNLLTTDLSTTLADTILTYNISVNINAVSTLNANNPWTLQFWELDLLQQSNVATNTAPTNARERLYYANLVQGKYGQPFPYKQQNTALANNLLTTNINKTRYNYPTTPEARTYRLGKATAITKIANPTPRDDIVYDVNNLRKPIEVIKNPAPSDAVIYDANNINRLKLPQVVTPTNRINAERLSNIDTKYWTYFNNSNAIAVGTTNPKYNISTSSIAPQIVSGSNTVIGVFKTTISAAPNAGDYVLITDTVTGYQAVTPIVSVSNSFIGPLTVPQGQATGGGGFTVPANVYSISVVVVGGGGSGYQGPNNSNAPGGGGGGGGLAWKNNISVTPGQNLTGVNGTGGVPGGTVSTSVSGNDTYYIGINSYSYTGTVSVSASNITLPNVTGLAVGMPIYFTATISSLLLNTFYWITSIAGNVVQLSTTNYGTAGSFGSGSASVTYYYAPVVGKGGRGGGNPTGGAGGSYIGDGGGTGGAGGSGSSVYFGGGGGGAGGYTGSGGTGASAFGSSANAGAGGGAGGGGAPTSGTAGGAASGGGVGLLGQGANGAAGNSGPAVGVGSTLTQGGAGSGGLGGGNSKPGGQNNGQDGGLYGGGGGGAAQGFTGLQFAGSGADGGIRIIWPATKLTDGSTVRAFPSTLTADQSGTVSDTYGILAYGISVSSSAITNLNINNTWTMQMWDPELFAQSNITSAITNTTPTTPRERLYYATNIPGRYGNYFPSKPTSVGLANNISLSNIQKRLEIFKNPTPNDANIYDVFNITKVKMPSIGNPTPSDGIVYDVNILRRMEVLKNPTPRDDIAYDVTNVNKFRLPYTAVQLSFAPTSSNILKRIFTVKNPTPRDDLVYDVNNVNKFKVPALNNSVFYSPASNKLEVITNPYSINNNQVDFGVAVPNYSTSAFNTVAISTTGETTNLTFLTAPIFSNILTGSSLLITDSVTNYQTIATVSNITSSNQIFNVVPLGQVLFDGSGAVTGTGGSAGSLVGSQYIYTWTCPPNVYSVSVVCVGGGAGGWGGSGGNSYFINSSTVAGFGGISTLGLGYSNGGSFVGDGGGQGGSTTGSSGGGGAGGYSGAGGNNNSSAPAGGGGAGGIVFSNGNAFSGGGGVGILGQGASGTVGTNGSGGGGGSGGSNGGGASVGGGGSGGSYGGGGGGPTSYGGGGGGGLGWKNNISVIPGQTYTVVVGVGGSGGSAGAGTGGNGGGGAVRIIWPATKRLDGSTVRSFASTIPGNTLTIDQSGTISDSVPTYTLSVPTASISNLNTANTWSARLWDPEIVQQITVRTILPPTNARENLYYARLTNSKYGRIFPGKEVYNDPSNIISLGNFPSYSRFKSNQTQLFDAPLIYKVDNTILQSTISTNIAPTNPRENLYYARLVPGIYGTFFPSKNSLNDPSNVISLSKIDNSIAQSTVTTTVSPANPRERLFYSQLAPGKYGNYIPSKVSPGALPANVNAERLSNIDINYWLKPDNQNVVAVGQASSKNINALSLNALVTASTSGNNTVLTYTPNYYATFSGSNTVYSLIYGFNLFNQLNGISIVDFTIECWAYATTTTNAADFLFTTQGNFGLNMYHVGTTWYAIVGDQYNVYVTLSGTASLNSWHHFALTRSGNIYTFWIDGIAVMTATSAQPNIPNIGDFCIGSSNGGTNFGTFTGYISNLRFVKTAIYTGTFAPPTGPLNTIQNARPNVKALTGNETLLLTLQNSSLVDNSNFYSPIPYMSSTTYAAVSFPGTLTFPTFSPVPQGPLSPFTIEYWAISMYSALGPMAYNTTGGGAIPYSTGFSNGRNDGNYQGNGYYPYFASFDGTSWSAISSPTAITIGVWYHIAVSFDGSVVRLFVNGNNVASSNTLRLATNIGKTGFVINTNPQPGAMTNFRFVQGRSLYTNSFTPSGPLTAVPGTVLLTLQDAVPVDNSINSYPVIANNIVTSSTPGQSIINATPAIPLTPIALPTPAINDYLLVTDINNNQALAQITATTATTITVPTSSLANLNTSSNLIYQLWDPEVFAQTNVRTTTSTGVARENLYYATLAKGRYGRTFPNTIAPAAIRGEDYVLDVNTFRQLVVIKNPTPNDAVTYDPVTPSNFDSKYWTYPGNTNKVAVGTANPRITASLNTGTITVGNPNTTVTTTISTNTPVYAARFIGSGTASAATSTYGYVGFNLPAFLDWNNTFCIEFWFYANSFGTQNNYALINTGGGSSYTQVNVRPTGINFTNPGFTSFYTFPFTIATGQWHHIAIMANPTNTWVALNGVSQNYAGVLGGYSAAYGPNNLFGQGIYLAGANPTEVGAMTQDFYLSGFRIVTGSTVYNTNGFTRPTTVPKNITGTQVLLFTTTAVTDASNNTLAITASSRNGSTPANNPVMSPITGSPIYFNPAPIFYPSDLLLITDLVTNYQTIANVVSSNQVDTVVIPTSQISNLNPSNTWSLQAWAADLMTQSNIVPNTSPATARDRLYYSTTTPGRYGQYFPSRAISSITNNVNANTLSNFDSSLWINPLTNGVAVGQANPKYGIATSTINGFIRSGSNITLQFLKPTSLVNLGMELSTNDYLLLTDTNGNQAVVDTTNFSSVGSGAGGTITVPLGQALYDATTVDPTLVISNATNQRLYTWTCPANVFSVSVVAVGGGSGGGGGLGWKNNITVVPGQTYTVAVGLYGGVLDSSGQGFVSANGGDSYFINASLVKGGGAPPFQAGSPYIPGGNFTGDGGGSGGYNSEISHGYAVGPPGTSGGGGGGGAGGYGGNGGNPGYDSQPTAAAANSGGGGGGGGVVLPTVYSGWFSGPGGGVGVFGIGNTGAAVPNGSNSGNPGSTNIGNGIAYGGGGYNFYNVGGLSAQSGAVRIIWPSKKLLDGATVRSFGATPGTTVLALDQTGTITDTFSLPLYNVTVPTSSVANLNLNNTVTIQLWEPDLYKQVNVRTNTPPSKPRENLYYAQLTKGTKYGVQIPSQIYNTVPTSIAAGNVNKFKQPSTGNMVFYSPVSNKLEIINSAYWTDKTNSNIVVTGVASLKYNLFNLNLSKSIAVTTSGSNTIISANYQLSTLPAILPPTNNDYVLITDINNAQVIAKINSFSTSTSPSSRLVPYGQVLLTGGSITGSGATYNGYNVSTNQYQYSWTAPANVYSVSVVAVGGGGGGQNWVGGGGQLGGGGGGLGWANNIPVIPGQTYNVTAGAGGPSSSGVGGNSSFTGESGIFITATGSSIQSIGGSYSSNATSKGGGNGGTGGISNNYQAGGAGGGGAGGYNGTGGTGGGTAGSGNNAQLNSGAGGGGGGRGGPVQSGFGGGGVSVFGIGADGTGGAADQGGGGGSGGGGGYGFGGPGGSYGGGGGGGAEIAYQTQSVGSGANGAIRIIWPAVRIDTSAVVRAFGGTAQNTTATADQSGTITDYYTTYNISVPTSYLTGLNTDAGSLNIQFWDPEVIPQATIRTNLPPVNPRENLYYAQLLKGKYGTQDFISSQLENNTSLFLTDTGLLTKYKTGAFGKGVADPSAAPKAPVQFWN